MIEMATKIELQDVINQANATLRYPIKKLNPTKTSNGILSFMFSDPLGFTVYKNAKGETYIFVNEDKLYKADYCLEVYNNQ
jgi:hypothetical protein